MKLIGVPPISPVLFYSGKIAGFSTWGFLILSTVNLIHISNPSLIVKVIAYFMSVIGLLFTVISLTNLGESTRLGLPNSKTVFKKNGLYRISRNPNVSWV